MTGLKTRTEREDRKSLMRQLKQFWTNAKYKRGNSTWQLSQQLASKGYDGGKNTIWRFMKSKGWRPLRRQKKPLLTSLSIRRFWGKRGKMEAKKGESWRRETPDTDAFTGAFHPHTAWFDTIQSKSVPVIGLSASRVKKLAENKSGRASVLVLLRFRFFLKPPMRSFRILVM